MTKRIGSFSDNVSSKRQKTVDDIEDLWGDDLDENAIDDCIKFESQCLSQFTQEHSILPSYNGFLKPNGLLSSTQLNSHVRPSTSNENVPPSTELEKQVTVLKSQVGEKNGEVVYLRAEIRKLESALEIQQKKTNLQWKEKLNVTATDLKSVKSELEFKNLEIANLKQRISEVQKQKYWENVALSQSQTKPQSKPAAESKFNEIPKRQPIVETFYPLKTELPHTLYHKEGENCVFEVQYSRNPVPSLQNQNSPNERFIGNKFKSFLSNKKELQFDYIHSDVLRLVNCTQEELNSVGATPHINKIVCASLQLLLDFHHFLTNISNHIQIERIQQSDTYYLENRSFDFDNQECGVHVTKCLTIVAQLILHNDYLQSYVCRQKALIISDKEGYTNDFLFLKEKQYAEPFYYLNLVYKIVSLIGQIRKSHVTSNFLSVVVKFLINICKVNEYENVSTIFCEIVKELIFTRPKTSLVQDLCLLLKVASHYNSFIVYLMTNANNLKVKRDIKKGIIHFKKDSCRLYMFVVLFDNTLYRIATEKFEWSVCLNLLSFIYNSYKYSFESHYCSVKSCECLPQLNKLVVEVIFKAVEKFNEEKKCISEGCKVFFESKMMQNMVYLMSFTSYENLAKYISVYSQFKEIENCLLNEEELKEFEKLNLSEDVSEIDPKKFENIDFL